MAIVQLTQSNIKKLKCPEGKKSFEYVDSNRSGLYVRVSATSSTFYFRFKNSNGKTQHIKIGATAELHLSEAKHEVARLKRDIATGKIGADTTQVPTLTEFFEKQYTPHAKSRKRSFHKDESLFRLRMKERFGDKRLNEITRRECQEFHTYLAKVENLAPATCDHHLVLLRRLFNLAVSWDIIDKNPLTRIELFKADNQVENYLDGDELKRLLHVLNTHPNRMTCSVMLFLLSTGARLNEALHAKWKHIDLERRVWLIPSTNAKSKKARPVPLNDSAIAVLKKLDTQDKSEFLFLNRSGERLTSVHTGWNTLRQAAGLPNLRIHDLRHSFASFLVNSGRTLYEVQQILGHSVPNVTQRYSHLSTKTLQMASNAASDRISGAFG